MIYNYTFKSGLKVEGTIEQISAIATAIKEALDLSKFPRMKGFYWSESKKVYVKMTEMNSLHLRNALSKTAAHYFEQIRVESAKKTDKEYATAFLKFADNELIQELFNELVKR